MFKFDKIKDFWCMKVLPTVYEDSLSYYEVLCKVIRKVNEIIDKIAELPDKIREMIKEEMANYEIPLATKDKIGGIYAEDGTDEDSVPVRIKNGFLFVKNMLYTLKQANDIDLGGVRAPVRVATDTQPVRIDPETGLLYTAPGTGGGGGGGVEGLHNIDDFDGETVEEKIENAQQTLGPGSTVFFPAGEYVFTKPVVLYKRLRFVGLGGILSWERPKFVFKLDGTSTTHDGTAYDYTSCFHILVTDFVFENINFSYQTELPTSTFIGKIFMYNPTYAEDETRSIAIRKAFFQCSAITSELTSATVYIFGDANLAHLQTVIFEDVRIDNGFTRYMETNVSHVILRRVYAAGITGYHATNNSLWEMDDIRMVIIEECDFNENILGSQSNYETIVGVRGLDKTAVLSLRNSRFDVSMATSWLGSIVENTNGTVPVMSAYNCQFIFAKSSSGTSYHAIEGTTVKGVSQAYNTIVAVGCIAKGAGPDYMLAGAHVVQISGCVGIGCSTNYALAHGSWFDGTFVQTTMLPGITVTGATVNSSKKYYKDGVMYVNMNLNLTALTGTFSMANTDGLLCKAQAHLFGIMVDATNTYAHESTGVIKGTWWSDDVDNLYGADTFGWAAADGVTTGENVLVCLCIPVGLKKYHVAA